MSRISGPNSKILFDTSFNGLADNVEASTAVTVSCIADVSGTVTVRQSMDASTWTDKTNAFSVVASTYVEGTFPLSHKFLSVRWVSSGGTPTADNSRLLTKVHDAFPFQVTSSGSVNVVTSNLNSTTVWDNVSTGAGGTSATHDCRDGPNVSFFGTVDGVTTLTSQLSNDDSNWYGDTNTYTTSASEDINMNITTGARYIRLRSSADVTATIIASSK